MPYPTYPTNIDLTPRQISFTSKTLATSFISPMTGKEQTVRYSGQYWELDLQYAPLFQSNAEELWGFYNSLNGKDGGFYFTLPNRMLMTGSLSVTVGTDGNTFTGGTGQIGKFGFCQNRLVQFTGTGSLFPRLPYTGASTSINTSGGALMQLTNNDLRFDTDYMRLYGVTIGIMEKI